METQLPEAEIAKTEKELQKQLKFFEIKCKSQTYENANKKSSEKSLAQKNYKKTKGTAIFSQAPEKNAKSVSETHTSQNSIVWEKKPRDLGGRPMTFPEKNFPVTIASPLNLLLVNHPDPKVPFVG